jgi:hypothetical protein
LQQEAFIWDSIHGMRRLQDALTDLGVDMSEWSILGHATGISDDGTKIVGVGIRNGNNEGFIVNLVPEPGSVVLAAIGVCSLLLTARRRRRARVA